MTTQRDRWYASYGTGGSEPDSATQRGAPEDERAPLCMLALSTVLVLLGGVIAVLVSRAESDPRPVPAPPYIAAPAVPRDAGRPPVSSQPIGTATLSEPTIATVKAPYRDSTRWCSLLTAADVQAATGFDQQGPPDSAWLCTHYLAGQAGHFFVSDIPASVGSAVVVRGNTAIVYQHDPAACEVSVALNRGGGVLDIDLRGVTTPRVPVCEAAMALAARAVDRLPDA